MFRLGQALLGCGEQTAKVELILRRIASAYGMRRSRVVVFPTALFISVTVDDEERVTLAEGPTQVLRLDQIADVYELSDSAQRGEIPPKEGVDILSEIYRKPARFGPIGVVVGHTILTVGLAMILTTSAESIAATAVLGAVVGLFKVFNRNRAVFAVPLPVLSATIVSMLVFVAVKMGFPLDPRCAIIPPLVSFLPGGMLTLGMVELAYGDMVSGASRLISGFVQLVLLAFGLGAGAMLVGYHPENLVDAPLIASSVPPNEWLPWLPWFGVLVFGLGAYLHFSAPRNSLLWMLLVLVITFATEQGTAQLVGSANVSGFFAMLVVTPLGYLIQLRFRGPPAIVTFLPSFWLLVPGALGLLSVTSMFGDREAGIDGLIDAIFALVSIALGSLVGASLYKWLTETFGWWQLQLGRVEGYIRRKKKR
jgi:uncharacterized membrane protein YjjP (DUF1212 family)/uncharacterized membrane protein YjjB (DUF3815 family)